MTDSDDTGVARTEGAPVGIVFPDQDGMGTLIIPHCAVLIKGGPNPEAGRQFIDFLLRPETAEALAQSEAAQMPLRLGVQRSRRIPFHREDPRDVRRLYELGSNSPEDLGRFPAGVGGTESGMISPFFLKGLVNGDSGV